MAKCTEKTCIQLPSITMLNDKLDNLIADRKEQSLKRDAFEAKIFAKFDELDEKYLRKDIVKIVFWTIGLFSSIVVSAWQLTQWFSNNIK